MNSTAPVHEFRCLYTHDLRRKQKRWQDGFLKYHTFNKRAMVYDTLRNFIGDTHWQASEGIGEGDEVELEAGVVVQVGEQVGLSETDLRPIFERPKKRRGREEEDRGGDGVKGAEASSAAQLPREVLRHKSLNTLLGPPKGTLGKAALPAKSPFELNNEAVRAEGRVAKRQRKDAQASWTVTRVTTPMKGTKNKETPLRARMADARAKRTSTQATRKAIPRIAGQMSLKVKEVIDITSENDDNAPLDITLPDSPPLGPSAIPALQPKRTSALLRSHRRDSPPPFDPSPEPRSPPVSTRNKFINVDADPPPGTVDITDINRRTDRCQSPQSNPRLKPIKLVKSKPRNMLLCEKNNPKILKTKSISTTDPQLLCGVDNGPQIVNEELHGPASEGLLAAKHTVKKPMRQSASGTGGLRKKAEGTAQASTVLSEQLEAKRKNQEKGPWTVEALDFFDWRPPDWDARVKQNALELEGRA